MRPSHLFAAAAILSAAATGFASQLSGNIVVNGNFESTANIKAVDSPLTVGETGEPVRSWQFHPGGNLPGGGVYAGDWGNWIGWSGISTHADPLVAWNQSLDVAPINRSTVSGNSFLEGAYFRFYAAQVIQAPANHVLGNATINFDYWFNKWDTDPGAPADSMLHLWIGGLNDENIPTPFDRASPIWGGNPYGDIGAAVPGAWETLNPLWNSPDWQTWGWSGIGEEKPDVGSQGLMWHTFSATNPGEVTFNIPSRYKYYYVSVWECVYSEYHEYFNDYNPPRVRDQMATGVDNIDFRVLTALLADTNLDTLRNALDIQSFVARVTGSLPYMPEADCNQDGVVNALDIQKFVYYITGGTGSVVPEPATLGLLALGLLGLARRR